ncbi:MAG: glucosaminidase domain-containing protein [Acidimicrobiia bacterium]|jgi:predicted  nucleic acid-binding Zn-ribbon protein
MALLLVTAVASPPARAQVDPEVTQLSDDLGAVRRQLDTTNAQLISARDQRAVLESRIADVNDQIADLHDRIVAAQADIDVLVAQRDAVLETLRKRAAVLYTLRQPTSPLASLTVDAPMDLARRRVLGQAVAKKDDDTRAALEAAGDKLAAARDELAVQRTALEAQETDLHDRERELNDLDAQIRAQQAELDARAKDLQARLQAAIAAGVLRAGGPSLLGPTNLSAAQMAGWWRAQGYSGYSVSVPIDALAQIYVDEANAEGVRGDLAFAQAVVETGGFRYTSPGNNFAGMGWCDSCTNGRAFPTPLDGVRAQIQHLKNYGDQTSRAANLAHPASVYWYAPSSLSQAVANENFDTFFAKGWALTWNQMGNGNWATDPNYSQKVLKVYAGMVASAQSA